MCEADHGCDLSEGNASRVQGGVDVLGNLVIRPTPPEVVADEVRHPDEGSSWSGGQVKPTARS